MKRSVAYHKMATKTGRIRLFSQKDLGALLIIDDFMNEMTIENTSCIEKYNIQGFKALFTFSFHLYTNQGILV